MAYTDTNSRLYGSPEFGAYVKALRAKSPPPTWAAISRLCKRDFNYLGNQAALKSWWKDGGRDRSKAMDDSPLNLEELKRLNRITGRVWDGYLRLSGDFMLTCDWHIPHFSADMTDKMMRVAKRFKIKRMIIGGDFLNLDTLSTWDGRDMEDKTENDITSGAWLLKGMLKWFDQIYWTVGNHDQRILRSLGYGLDLGALGRMLVGEAVAGERLICSNYAYAILDGRLRVTHPKSYSRKGGAVPAALADKYRMSVVGAHGHHIGMQPSSNKDDVGIDLGGMFDASMIHYITHEDSTHSMWTSAFGMWRHGTFYHFHDNKILTDWDYWLPKRGK